MKLPGRLIAVTLMVIPQIAAAAAPQEPWYAGTVSAFSEAAYIEAKGFSAGTKATRAEFVELVLRLLGGKIHLPFGEPVFDDIGLDSPFFATFQEGARGKWVRGVKSCAGSRPCAATPFAPVNRAEAAALIIRAFAVRPGTQAPSFGDNLPDQWYTEIIRAAASRCILQGDDGTGKVRPGDSMNRAEMLAMLHRAMQVLDYPECKARTSIPLPQAEKQFMIVQTPAVSVSSTPASAALSSSSPSSSTSSSSFSRSSSASVVSAMSSSSLHSSSTIASSASSSSTATPLTAPGSSSSVTTSAATGGGTSVSSQDPRYADLLGKFQQYVMEYSGLIARTRTAEGEMATQLLTVLRSQIDLLNQLYPSVELARSRVLTESEWSSVVSLQNRIETGFAQAPR